MGVKQDLPHVRQGMLDAGAVASRPYYLWFSAVDANIKQNQADIAALQQGSGGGGSSAAQIIGSDSVAVAGSIASGAVILSLVNDEDSVLAHARYGSDSGGGKGWALIADDFADSANIAKSTDVDNVVSFDLTDVTMGTGGVLLAIATDSKGRVVQQHAVTVTGTTHQVIVTGGDGSGSTIVLATPQDIDTASSPSFATVNLGADPTGALQAATKQYVDSIANGLSWKAPCLLATTANDTLSGLAARDGVTPVAGSRVLVMNQTAPADNGIYVAASGAWSRASDMSTWAQVPNASVFVEQGTANADKGFTCTADPGGTLGVTAIPFVQFNGGGSGGVTSFNTRTGAVVPITGDYTFSQIGGTLASSQLPSSGVTAGTYGDASHVAQVTVDAHGIVTAAAAVAIQENAARVTVTISSPTGVTVTGTATLSSVARLLTMATTKPCRLRLYTTVANRNADLSRLVAQYPPPGSGLLFEGVTDPTLTGFDCGPVPELFNNESTVGNTIAYTLEPATAVATSATLTYQVIAP